MVNVDILNRNQINDQLWDNCVSTSTSPLVYGLAWYLDIICEEWKGAVIQSADDYMAVCPIPILKRGIFNVVRKPLFAQQLGIFSSAETEFPSLNLLLSKVFEEFKYINPLYFNYANTKLIKESSYPKLKVKFVNNPILPLNKSYDQVFKSYRRDRKKDLRKAREIDQKIVESDTLSPIILMFKESVEPKFAKGIHPLAFDFLNEIFTRCLELNIGHVFYTQYPDGSYGSGCFFVIWKNRITYLFNAAYQKNRIDNGRMLIINHVIEKHANSGYTFDFESPRDQPSISMFYESFGTQKEVYSELVFEDLPLPITIVRKFRKLLHDIF